MHLPREELRKPPPFKMYRRRGRAFKFLSQRKTTASAPLPAPSVLIIYTGRAISYGPRFWPITLTRLTHGIQSANTADYVRVPLTKSPGATRTMRGESRVHSTTYVAIDRYADCRVAGFTANSTGALAGESDRESTDGGLNFPGILPRPRDIDHWGNVSIG